MVVGRRFWVKFLQGKQLVLGVSGDFFKTNLMKLNIASLCKATIPISKVRLFFKLGWELSEI